MNRNQLAFLDTLDGEALQEPAIWTGSAWVSLPRPWRAWAASQVRAVHLAELVPVDELRRASS